MYILYHKSSEIDLKRIQKLFKRIQIVRVLDYVR